MVIELTRANESAKGLSEYERDETSLYVRWYRQRRKPEGRQLEGN